MATKTRRYTRAQIKTGQFELPDRYQFLDRNKYEAVVSRAINGRVTWTVELGMMHAKKVFNADDRTKTAQAEIDRLMQENADLKKMLASQEVEMQSLKSEKDAMERNLDTVLANIESDSSEIKSADFPGGKSFWSAIENQKNFIPIALQGGFAGSKKK